MGRGGAKQHPSDQQNTAQCVPLGAHPFSKYSLWIEKVFGQSCTHVCNYLKSFLEKTKLDHTFETVCMASICHSSKQTCMILRRLSILGS